jgi:hypothetical protein
MVAKAAWLSVEPRVCLSEYLASEELEYASGSQNWAGHPELSDNEEQELRCSGDDLTEIE